MDLEGSHKEPVYTKVSRYLAAELSSKANYPLLEYTEDTYRELSERLFEESFNTATRMDSMICCYGNSDSENESD